jgi:hypothetical protein
MLVQSGRIAALVVVAVILAQTLCPAHLMAATTTGIAAPLEQSGCHPGFPVTPSSSTPAAPNSGQKCCVRLHHPEAIPAARYIPAAPMTISVVSTPFCSFTIASFDPNHGPALISTSPGLFVLRI